MTSTSSRYQTTPVGKYIYGALIEPDVSDFGTAWKLGFVLSEAESIPLFEIIETALDAKRREDAMFPKMNDKLFMPFKPSYEKNEAGEKVLKDGEYIWNFKKPYERKTRLGEIERNAPPTLYDGLGRIITGKVERISYGSTGKVVFTPYVCGNRANKGISFQLVGFQIASLSVDGPSLDAIEGGFTLGDDSDGAFSLES